jgi:hypothetical protein
MGSMLICGLLTLGASEERLEFSATLSRDQFESIDRDLAGLVKSQGLRLAASPTGKSTTLRGSIRSTGKAALESFFTGRLPEVAKTLRFRDPEAGFIAEVDGKSAAVARRVRVRIALDTTERMQAFLGVGTEGIKVTKKFEDDRWELAATPAAVERLKKAGLTPSVLSPNHVDGPKIDAIGD